MMRTQTAAVRVLLLLAISSLVITGQAKSDRCESHGLPKVTRENVIPGRDKEPIFRLELKQDIGNSTHAGNGDYVVNIAVTSQVLAFDKVSIKVSTTGKCGYGSFRYNSRDYSYNGSKGSCPVYHHVKKGHGQLQNLPPLEWSPPKCGCVQFRASITESEGLVYGDQKDAFRGHLLKTVCFNGRVEREVYAKALCKGIALYPAFEMAQKSQSPYAIEAFNKRKSQVAECCLKSRDDQAACLEVVRARRINNFCQTGEPDLSFTPMRRRHMMNKMDECCYFLGRQLYYCFERKSTLELNRKGSTFLDYSMDEFNPLNDLARFLTLRDMDKEIYDMLSPDRFDLNPPGILTTKAIIIAEVTHGGHKAVDKSKDNVPFLPSVEKSNTRTKKVGSKTYSSGQRSGFMGAGGRSKVPYKDEESSKQTEIGVNRDYLWQQQQQQQQRHQQQQQHQQPPPQQFDVDDVGLHDGGQEIGQTSAEVEEIKTYFSAQQQLLKVKEDCCVHGIKTQVDLNHKLKGACRQESENFDSAAVLSNRGLLDRRLQDECSSLFVTCCLRNARKQRSFLGRSSRLERRVDPRELDDERGDALNVDPKDHLRRYGSPRSVRRDLVDDFDRASEARYQSMGRSGERRGIPAEEVEDEEEEEEEQDGPARFDSVDNEDEQIVGLRSSRDSALLSRNRNRALTERKSRPRKASEEMSFDDRTFNSQVRDEDEDEEEEENDDNDDSDGEVESYASLERRVVERKNNFAKEEILRSHPDQRPITRTLPRPSGPYRTVQSRNSGLRKSRGSRVRNSQRRSGENRMSRKGKGKSFRRNRSSRRSRNSRRRQLSKERRASRRASRRKNSRKRSSRRRNSKARTSHVRYSLYPKSWLSKALEVPVHLDSREMSDYGRRNRKGAYDSKEMRDFQGGMRPE